MNDPMTVPWTWSDTEEEAAARLAKSWRTLYDALKAQGFTTVETLALVTSYISGGAAR